jgi:hypothetical protein
MFSRVLKIQLESIYSVVGAVRQDGIGHWQGESLTLLGKTCNNNKIIIKITSWTPGAAGPGARRGGVRPVVCTGGWCGTGRFDSVAGVVAVVITSGAHAAMHMQAAAASAPESRKAAAV